MKQILFLLFFTFTATMLHAQSVSLKWAQQMENNNNQSGEAIVTDKLGNVFSFGLGSGLTKSDPDGHIIWSTKNITEFGTAIAVDGNGNVYVTGPGFVSKFDGTGNFIWSKQFGSLVYIDSDDNYVFTNTYISIDANGNIYISGLFNGNADFDPGPNVHSLTSNGNWDGFVLKLDSSGSFLWVKQVGSLFNFIYNSITDIAVDGHGNVYTAGDDGSIFKLDSSGNLLWSIKQSGGIGCYSIAIDANENVYASGTFSGTVDFDPGPGIYRVASDQFGNNYYLSKLGADGNFLWAKKMDYYGFYAGDIALDKNANIYTTGKFQGNKDFDPGASTYYQQSVGNTYDIFVSKIDSSGNFIWAKQMGGAGDDNGTSIAVDGDANIFVTGFFTLTADFDPGTDVFNLTSTGPQPNYNSFVLKLSQYSIGNGLNYKYYEGDFNTLPAFSTLTPVKTGSSSNVDISVRPTGVDDHFAFEWDGTINLPSAGTYTFETVSDDGSKLTLNGNILVNNDGLHPATSATGTITVPAAGAYPISITYFEKDGGQSMQVYWTGPGISRQLIPDIAFAGGAVTPPASNGLNYKYYEGNFNTLPDFTTLTPVKTGTSANADISIRPAGVDDHFAFVWEGTINIPTAGTYTFETISDDGSKVYFNMPYSSNGNSLVSNDGLHAPTSGSGTINIPMAGAYPITITYFEKDGGQTMQLYWMGPGITRQLIPDVAFISGTTPPAGKSGLNYKYYEGNFNALPNYSLLTPVKSGTSNNVDIGIRPSGINDHFAFMWYGYIDLPSAGTYTFETISDDGSRVSIDNPYSFSINIVNNDGLHAPQSSTGTVTVPAAGKYPITITYFEKDGGETMQFYWTGPGFSRQAVPDAAFTRDANGSTVMSGSTSNLINLTKENPETSAMPKVYPNPFVESFTIDYYNTGSVKNKVSIGVYDLNGKLIYQYQPASISVGHNSWRINFSRNKLASGVYMAQLKVNGIPEKIIKLIKK